MFYRVLYWNGLHLIICVSITRETTSGFRRLQDGLYNFSRLSRRESSSWPRISTRYQRLGTVSKKSLINPYKKVFCANHLINWALLFSAFPEKFQCFVVVESHIWKIPPFHYTFDVSKDIRLVQDHWHHCSLQHLAASSCPSSTVPLLRRRLDLHGPPSQTAMALLTVRRQLAAGAEVPAVSMGQSQVQEVFWLEVMAWS